MIKLTTRWSSMNSMYRKLLKLVKLGKIATNFFPEEFWLISLSAML